MSTEISTLTEFIEWTEQFSRGQYLFRGVSNEKYKIEASAWRRLEEDNSNPTKLLKINEEMLSDARLQGHDLKNGQLLTDLELLAELQHYGAATCLIDFTYSAQVALWMACRRRSKWDVNGKVFAVRIDNPVIFKKITPASLQENLAYFFKTNERRRYPLYQWQPKQQNNRIIAQQSVFLFGGAKIKAEVECIILKSSKETILTSLKKSSGITEARMFPDFEGFARLRAHDRPYVEHTVQDLLVHASELMQEDRYDDAILYYDAAISLQPDDRTLAEAHYYRANAYRRKYGIEKVDEVIKEYNKVIELEPDNPQGYERRGFTYLFGKGEIDLAIKDYNKMIELDPFAAEGYAHRGFAYFGKGEMDKAIQDYTKAIKLEPNDPTDYINRASAYLNKGDFILAINDYTKAIELKPNDSISYYHRGLVWLRLQNWENAKADLLAAEYEGMDIASLFSQENQNLAEFEKEIGVELPKDIAAILTQQ